MLISRLKDKFNDTEPIFTEDIFECMKDYSRQRVYQLIDNAIECGSLARFDRGVYFIPREADFGRTTIVVEDVVDRKYVKNNGEVFGVYGRLEIEVNFLVSFQVPNTIEVITNKESRDLREIEIDGRKVILRKSRCKITKDNQYAYTLLELFNFMDMKRYKKSKLIQEAVTEYIRKMKITRKDIMNIADYFPSKAMKNMAIGGVLYEIAQ